ncbi:MAG TPA: FtsX-like permease family protein [Longimicrobiales bacterium]
MTDPGRSKVAVWPLALGTAAGLAAVALVAPLPFAPLPPADWAGLAWTEFSLPAGQRQAAALVGLTRTLILLAGGTCLLGLGTVAILVTATASSRRREMAVRGALGETGRSLARRLLRDTGTPLLRAGLGRGLLLGACGGLLLRFTWPMAGADTGPAEVGAMAASGLAVSWLPRALTVSALVLAVLAVAAAVTVAVALLPVRHGTHRLAAALGAGARATSDPREGGLRRILVGLQLTASMALLCGAALVVRSLPSPGAAGDAATSATLLVPIELVGAPEDPDQPGWARRQQLLATLIERVRTLPTLRSESIADPGAWAGAGQRDLVLAQCGNCSRGTMPTPILGGVLDHHVVTPGFFAQAGMALVSGRDFAPGDRAGAEPVAVVTLAFARSHFENGDPLGRQVRIGREFDAWYTVVGVVESATWPGIGVTPPPVPAVYLAAFQHPPKVAVLAVEASSPLELEPIRALVDGVPGVRRADQGGTVAEHRRGSAAPLRWTGRAALALGAAALVLSLMGVGRVARVEVRARRRELGTRMALGASPRGLARHVLGRSLRVCLASTALAIPAATALTARLGAIAGDVALFDLAVFAPIAVVVCGAAIVGVLEPARRAAGADPAVILSEE